MNNCLFVNKDLPHAHEVVYRLALFFAWHFIADQDKPVNVKIVCKDGEAVESFIDALVNYAVNHNISINQESNYMYIENAIGLGAKITVADQNDDQSGDMVLLYDIDAPFNTDPERCMIAFSSTDKHPENWQVFFYNEDMAMTI